MSLQSIRNNLTKAKKIGVKDAGKACFYLKRLHKETGISEQYLLAEMVIDAVEKTMKYEQHREKLLSEWEDSAQQR